MHNRLNPMQNCQSASLHEQADGGPGTVGAAAAACPSGTGAGAGGKDYKKWWIGGDGWVHVGNTTSMLIKVIHSGNFA